MYKKPTNQELKQRIRELEKRIRELEPSESGPQKHSPDVDNKYQQIAEAIPGVVFQLVRHTNGSISVPYISKRIFDYSGKRPEDIISNPSLLLESVPRDDREILNKAFENSSETLVKIILEHRAICPDGSVKSFHMECVPEAKENKDILWNGISIDITSRKQAEEALVESESRYRSVSKLTSDYAYSFSVEPDGNLVNEWVTGALTRLTGYSRQELHSLGGWEHMILPEDMSIPVGQFKALLSNQAKTIEYRILTKDSRIRWMRDYARPTWSGAEKRVTRIQGAIQDITERKWVEEELRHSNDKLTALIQASPMAIIALDSEGKITLWNPAAEKIYGWKEKEALGTYPPLIPAEKRSEHRAIRKDVLNGEEHHDFETVRLKKNGTAINVSISTAPLKNEAGLIDGIMSVSVDITDRKQSEETLRKSNQRFATVMNSIDATVYVADMQTFEILFMNKQMIRIYGKDLTGDKCWDAFRGQSEQCPDCTNDQLIDKNVESTGVCTWQGKNPVNGKWYINYDRAIEWTDGRRVKLQIATDITSLKKMERQLQESQKFEAIGTLAGGIAHDFNNLLMGIQGRASLMKTSIESSHPDSEHLDEIEEYIRSATDLTKQLLGFARGGKYEVRPMDINELLNKSAELFGRTRKEIRIHTKFLESPLTVEVDRRQIDQVLLNIFINAWQAMPDGGELYLETKIAILDQDYCEPYGAEPGRYAMVLITDTGIGMGEATQQRIFDPFYTTKDKGRGTGLGLASAYGIIKNHGGIITVHSEVGQGTTFNIYLPISDKEAQGETPAKDSFLKGSENILLIDDEELIVEVGQAMLKELGYRVVVANGGRQAIDAVNQKGDEIDLVILDLIMPDMGGGKVFDRIRAIRPQVPIILSSGYSINGQANEIMKRGCNGFLQKPFSITDLSQKVRRILDEAKGAT